MKLQFIEAGEIATTHGIKGEVKVLPGWTARKTCAILTAAVLTARK